MITKRIIFFFGLLSLFLGCLCLSRTSQFAQAADQKIINNDNADTTETQKQQVTSVATGNDANIFSKNTPPESSITSPPTKASMTEEDVAPPTSADGVRSKSRNGFIMLGIPFRTGFIIQPQAEQYILEGNEANVDVKSTGIDWNIFTSVKVYLTKWTLQPDGTYVKEADPTPYTAKGNGLNKNEATIRFGPNGRENLPVGTYFFQMSVRYTLLTYYTQLAKVVVVSDESAATSIKVTPESTVVFPDISYDVTANLNPTESTSVVTWDDTGLPDYEPEFGRTVAFSVANDKISNQVNTDTEHPGIAVPLTGKANNLTDTATVYVGGLKAQSIPLDQAQKYGIGWSVAGLDKIYNNFYDPDSGEAATITKSAFKWTYFVKNSKGGYTENSFGKEVTNASGTFTVPNDLNDSKALQIPGSSSFITDAKTATDKGDPYYVKLTITISIKTGLISSKNIIINSNQAQLWVTPAVGELSLLQVPNFTFAEVNPQMVYYGNTTLDDTYKPSSIEDNATNLLEITDTRPGQQGWTLQAQLSQLSDSNNQLLSGLGVKLKGMANDILVPDTGQWTTVTDSTINQTGAFPMDAILYIDPNPNAQLNTEQTFHGTMTWSLTPVTPAAQAL